MTVRSGSVEEQYQGLVPPPIGVRYQRWSTWGLGLESPLPEGRDRCLTEHTGSTAERTRGGRWSGFKAEAGDWLSARRAEDEVKALRTVGDDALLLRQVVVVAPPVELPTRRISPPRPSQSPSFSTGTKMQEERKSGAQKQRIYSRRPWLYVK